MSTETSQHVPTEPTNTPDSPKDEAATTSDVEKGTQNNGWGQGAAGGPPSFPDGGTRAWLVVLGSMLVMGCSFGYLSAFGYGKADFKNYQLMLMILPCL